MADVIAYKILTTMQFSELQREEVFRGSPADRADGYIHLSTAPQLSGTLEKHYAGQTGLFIATVDLACLAEILRWEPSRGGQLFPHLYGPLPIAAIIATTEVERLADGTLKLPG